MLPLEMATETLQTASNTREITRGSEGSSQDAPTREDEKNFIASVSHENWRRSPSEIARGPAEKRLGGSLRKLNIDDFQLIKTLGTGQ
jgi:hypothetical protein